ncbi:hypothetical protein GOP47_0027002 [Adiantum capillus-veneris]|nr:hypothetical protein GOP47_0027002 [Adiantum capillus-veneris]
MKKSTQMKKRVWCELPDALLERLLPLLPVSSLLRFRCVCKSWNSYIFSSDFLQLCSSSSSPSPAPASCSHGALHRPDSNSYLLLSTWSSDYPLLAFNPSRQTWHLPSLDFLRKPPKLAMTAASSALSVVAAAGGLLCLSDGGSKLVVCNPVTKTMREIECRVEEQEERGGRMLTDVVMASMRYEDEERSYELVLVGRCEGDEGRQVTCVYESRRHVWRREKQREALFFESSGVFLGSDFYVLTSVPLKLMVFSTQTGRWREHGAEVPAGVKYPCLVEIGGRLLLLAAVGEVEGDLKRYSVWRLEGLGWEEEASMPDSIFQQIGVKDGFEGLSCVSLKQSVYMTSSEGCLLWDPALLSWDWLPQSPILGGLFACIKDIYSMHPSLDNVT